MSILDAIILGLTQGITEFAPVSSSGHLVLMSHLLNENGAFIFNVYLNIGTLLALVIYYRERISSIITRFFQPYGWKLVVRLIIATIPAVFVGFICNDLIELLNTSNFIVILMLILVAIPMILVGEQNKNADDREIEKSVDDKKAWNIGLLQTMALIPGVSRSGITILAGLRQNLSAARAAEFSFMLGIPVLLGGILKTLVSDSGISYMQANFASILVGNIAAFVSGYFVIKYMIKLISSRGLKDFGWYRIGLALLMCVLIAINVLD